MNWFAKNPYGRNGKRAVMQLDHAESDKFKSQSGQDLFVMASFSAFLIMEIPRT